MKFSIDFNEIGKKDGDSILKALGAKEEYLPDNGEFLGYFIELNNFEEMKKLQEDIHFITDNNHYNLLLDFDRSNSIYIDDKL